MLWKVAFFNTKVKKETLQFPDGILSNLIHVFEMIEELGPNIGKPYTAPMGDNYLKFGLKERRGLADLFFVLCKGKEVIILHSFIKKTQKTPKRDIEKARKRMKEL